MTLNGQLEFSSNDASGGIGGALFSISLGQLELDKGSRIIFHNNTGK